MVIRYGFGILINLKRVRKEIIALMLGAAGLVVSLLWPVKGLPPILMTGFSSGVILSTIGFETAVRKLNPSSQDAPFPATQQMQAPMPHIREPKPRNSETLDEFDRALSSMKKGTGSYKQVVETMDRAITKLNAEYPEWEGEGRLRTYSVLKRISNLLDHENVDAFMGMTFKMLETRNDEAAEYTRTLLNGRVEKMYRDPEYESSKYVAGTLIMMNRKQKEYVEQIVTDAIHLWSQPRFEALKPELRILRMLKQEDRNSIAEMVMKEIVKAKLVKDKQVASRARTIMRALSEPKSTKQVSHLAPIPHAS